ncbi:MAG: haloacid dehalogenase, partial [Lachnospiraceae bacterium]|nr:haloacid dehalogenase [Lachnospiraceae bacterium]
MLGNKKLFLFDIDGTIALGPKLFDGSHQLLSYIEKELGRAYFISNNSTKSEADYVKY